MPALATPCHFAKTKRDSVSGTESSAAAKSLADTWCDTTTPPHGKLLTQMLGSIAEFERTLIKRRCDVGRERAKAAGIKFGRKPKLNAFQTL